MTQLKYYEDSYLQSLKVKIISKDEDWLEFDQTIFYPLGGGQPGDTGQLVHAKGNFNIVDCRKKDGKHLHQLENASMEIRPGDEVLTHLDWSRRYKHMKMHTAMHLLGSLIPVPVTGGSIGAEKSRLDFDLGDHQIDKQELTDRLNELIQTGNPIEFGSITEAYLDEHPELIRTMSVQPPKGTGDIRTVRITDIDYQPCGGTHLSSLSEIGKVRVSKIENKGKRNRRVHLVFDD